MTSDPDLLPQLSQKVLSSIALRWARKYEIVEKITLHRCVDEVLGAKYVVVFHHWAEVDDPRIDEFKSRWLFEGGSGIFAPGFDEVYMHGWDYRFRDEWHFHWRRIGNELPDYLDDKQV